MSRKTRWWHLSAPETATLGQLVATELVWMNEDFVLVRSVHYGYFAETAMESKFIPILEKNLAIQGLTEGFYPVTQKQGGYRP